MASYHDLKKQTYKEIRARPFTRIHGWPTWRLEKRRVVECKEAVLNYDVSYDWLGGYIWPPTINYRGSKIRSRQSNAASVHPAQHTQQHSHLPKRQSH